MVKTGFVVFNLSVDEMAQGCRRGVDEMGQSAKSVDEMGLDEMGLDEMGINRNIVNIVARV